MSWGRRAKRALKPCGRIRASSPSTTNRTVWLKRPRRTIRPQFIAAISANLSIKAYGWCQCVHFELDKSLIFNQHKTRFFFLLFDTTPENRPQFNCLSLPSTHWRLSLQVSGLWLLWGTINAHFDNINLNICRLGLQIRSQLAHETDGAQELCQDWRSRSPTEDDDANAKDHDAATARRVCLGTDQRSSI